MKRTPMRRRPRSTKYSRRERDTERMGWTKMMPCSVGDGLTPLAYDLWLGGDVDACRGPIEAHHAGVHGLSEKAPDDTVIPLCDHHHDSLTDLRGVFSGWPRGAVKAWELAVIEFWQSRYAATLSDSVPS